MTETNEAVTTEVQSAAPLAIVACCALCVDALIEAGGSTQKGELSSGAQCEWHKGPSQRATHIVGIDPKLLEESIRPVFPEPPFIGTEVGPVTEIAARLLACEGGLGEVDPSFESSKLRVRRAVGWAEALLNETKGR